MTTQATQIEFEVRADFALFAQPFSSIGGEHTTYHVPTYEALRGICDAIYWKPTIKWIIDEVRILHPIRTQAKGEIPMTYNGGSSIAYHTYLTNVRYQVRAHFVQNTERPELATDYNIKKHLAIAKRSIKQGGRMDIFLGVRHCQGYVLPCVYGEGDGYYDNETIHYGIMYHGFNYPTRTYPKKQVRFAHIEMKQGIIHFPKPDDCIAHDIEAIQIPLFREYSKPSSFTNVEDEYNQFGGDNE